MIKITKNQSHLFLNKKKTNYKEIGSKIREGKDIKVVDESQNDCTNEILTRVAFSRIPTVDELFLVLGKEKVLEIIENGGMENYLLKVARG